MEIIPAIIPKNYNDLKEKIAQVKDFVDHVQIDITDGIFVPSKSWPYNDFIWSSGILLELPFTDSCGFEFDLMIKKPEDNINDWVTEGAKRIIIHIESTTDLPNIISQLKGKVEIGLAFDIETPFGLHAELLSQADFIQLMGIEKIGFQGEPFTEKVFEKIKDLKERKPDVIISVDGGVSLENAKRLAEAGVSRIAIGSAIFESKNIEETIRNFKEIS